MKIAFFNANLEKGQDGVTRVMYKMFEGAIQRDAEAIAFTSTLPVAQDMIIPMFRVPSVVFPMQRNYRLALPSYKLFSRRLLEFRPDIIHVNSPCTLGFQATKFAHDYGIPVVATYHTHFPTYARYYNVKLLEKLTWSMTRYFYNKMDQTFVPTRPILEEIHKQGVKRVTYLPNGVDTSLFNKNNKSEEWRKRFGNGSKPIVLFVSRLVWEKDLRILAEMYSKLKSIRSDFEMVIVGDGHARKDLEKMMPGAHFLGYQSGKTLAESFSSSDIFVFPSTTETFGLVTLEAMASGLATVAAKVGGAMEIIEEGESGLFAEPLNSEDLAQKVKMLIQDPHRRKLLAENAFVRAQSYRWDVILDRLFFNYKQIIEQYKRTHFGKAA